MIVSLKNSLTKDDLNRFVRNILIFFAPLWIVILEAYQRWEQVDIKAVSVAFFISALADLLKRYTREQIIIKDDITDDATDSWDENDYLLEWSIDTILEKIKKSRQWDDIIIAYNQHTEVWSISACTLFAPLSVLSSLFNYELSKQQLRDMWEYAKTQWYREWKWNDSWVWTRVASQWWNNTFPEMRAIYFWTQWWSDDMYRALDHIKWVTTWYRWNASYNADRRDWVLNLTSWWKDTYWHRTTLYKVWEKYLTYDSSENYRVYEVPKENHKKYKNRHNWVYVFFPEKDFTPEEKKKFKDNRFSLRRKARLANEWK